MRNAREGLNSLMRSLTLSAGSSATVSLRAVGEEAVSSERSARAVVVSMGITFDLFA